jgi:BirA family biotin operon repressor/biotin-[acetyl-CoA-carboxylase] ligase
LLSILLRPQLEPGRLHLVTAAVALAAADACEQVAGVRPDLKWPNDLLVDDRKLAGVLAETVFPPGWAAPSLLASAGTPAPPGAVLPSVVVGIGINVNWRDTDVPNGGIALDQASGRAVDRDAVLQGLLTALEPRLVDWDALGSEYRRRCATVGRLVRVELSDETFTGTVADVTDEGHLLVDVGMCIRTVTAGDVVHLRPA